GPAEIKDVYFLTPLRMKDDEVSEVRLVLDKGDDGYEFYVASKTVSESPDQPVWQKHAMGKIRALAAGPVLGPSLREIIGRCAREDLILGDEDFFDRDLGPRWNSIRRVYRGTNELLALIELPADFSADLLAFALHPALMDRAAGVGFLFLVKSGSSYIPFSYESLKVMGTLPNRFFVHSRYREDADPTNEMTTFDITIMAEDGPVLVEVEGF